MLTIAGGIIIAVIALIFWRAIFFLIVTVGGLALTLGAAAFIYGAFIA